MEYWLAAAIVLVFTVLANYLILRDAFKDSNSPGDSDRDADIDNF